MIAVEHTHEFRVRLVSGEAVNLPEGWEQVKIEGDLLTYKADRRNRRVQVWPVPVFHGWKLNRGPTDLFTRALALLESLEK